MLSLREVTVFGRLMHGWVNKRKGHGLWAHSWGERRKWRIQCVEYREEKRQLKVPWKAFQKRCHSGWFLESEVGLCQLGKGKIGKSKWGLVFANEQRLEIGGAGWGDKKVGITQAKKEEGNDRRFRKKVSVSDLTGPLGSRSCLHPLPGHKWYFSGEFSNSHPNTKLIFLLISLREHLSKADAQNFRKKEGNYMAWK